MKIYLAARYSRRLELVGYADLLRRLGCTVTSRWLNGEHEMHETTRGLSGPDADAMRCRFASEDWDDVRAADLVISFTEPPRSETSASRGGRHVEFGAALALGRTCVVVGYRENVFHCLPKVGFYPTWDAFLRNFAGPAIDGVNPEADAMASPALALPRELPHDRRNDADDFEVEDGPG